MRTVLSFVTVAFVAELLCAAALLVVTGRGFVYSPGIGGPRGAPALADAFAIAAAAGLAAAVLFQVAAHAWAKQYFRLRWWRDFAMVGAIVAAIVAVAVHVGQSITHGA